MSHYAPYFPDWYSDRRNIQIIPHDDKPCEQLYPLIWVKLTGDRFGVWLKEVTPEHIGIFTQISLSLWSWEPASIGVNALFMVPLNDEEEAQMFLQSHLHNQGLRQFPTEWVMMQTHRSVVFDKPFAFGLFSVTA